MIIYNQWWAQQPMCWCCGNLPSSATWEVLWWSLAGLSYMGICSTPQVQGECIKQIPRSHPKLTTFVAIMCRKGLEERMLLCTLSLPCLKIQSAQLSRSGKWNNTFSLQPLKIRRKKYMSNETQMFLKETTSPIMPFCFPICFLGALGGPRVLPWPSQLLPRAVHF